MSELGPERLLQGALEEAPKGEEERVKAAEPQARVEVGPVDPVRAPLEARVQQELVRQELVRQELVKKGLVKKGLVKKGLVKKGLVLQELVKKGLVDGLRAAALERMVQARMVPERQGLATKALLDGLRASVAQGSPRLARVPLRERESVPLAVPVRGPAQARQGLQLALVPAWVPPVGELAPALAQAAVGSESAGGPLPPGWEWARQGSASRRLPSARSR